MASCPRCGGELPPAARFCPTCGRPVDPEFGPPAPPATAPIWTGLRLPDWMRTDWPLVGLGAALLLAFLFAESAIVGMIAAVFVSGRVEALPCGAGVGAHLAFAAFGARTVAGCGGAEGAGLAVSFLPLFWALTGSAATEAAFHFAWPRLVDDRRRRVAYGAKLALVTGVALGVIAGLVNGGDPQGGNGFGSSVDGGEVWFYATVLTGLWAWLALRRRAVRVLEPPAGAVLRFRPYRRMIAEGAFGFAGLATGLAVVGLVFGLVVADGGSARLGMVVGFPVVGFSLGAVLADGAMGAALAGVVGHSSLSQFGLPAQPGSAAAPAWLFAALLLAPAVAALTTWRRLDRDRPADEQGALATGAAVGAGFAAAAWVAALVGRVALVAFVGPNAGGGWFGPTGRFAPALRGAVVQAQPNPATVLGLALLWGLGGGLGAAFLWTSRHGVRWRLENAAPSRPPSGAGGQEAAEPAGPPDEPPAGNP